MSKTKGFLSIFIPSATVFISSACIMILELVASRLIARHLGSSLYTWTSVIGVVLAGITIGNYIGGRVADKFIARKALAVIFGLSSVACVVIVILNNLVGDWIWLWQFSWPVRVFSHVSLVFLLPSVLLGMISPVVAKMALDKGLATGRTVGDIYAWGAAGSIAGTFLAGFYLIATMGTIKIIWIIGAALLLMGILYWAKLWVLYIWAAIFVALMTMGMVPAEWAKETDEGVVPAEWAEWAKETGENMALREKYDPSILYEDNTQYCNVKVKRLSSTPDTRAFIQDKLRHSEIIIGDIGNLRFPYEQIHAAATHRLTQSNDILSTLVIGGGGYIFPRYIEKYWPGSRVDVVEIDPGVTKAAMEGFGLSKDTSINTFNMDARNYIDQLVHEENSGGQKTRYDFIYEDAITDYSIPYQLVTEEFNDKIAVLLGEDGVYMVVMIEIYNEGFFLGAYINTLEQTFDHVYVITTDDLPRSERNTFVVIAAMRPLDLTNLKEDYKRKKLGLWLLDENNIAELKEKAHNMILTDDFVPVENLISPVVRKSAVDFLAAEYLTRARKFASNGEFDKSIKMYQNLIDIDPLQVTQSYNDIAIILSKQNKIDEAIESLYKALEAIKKSGLGEKDASIHYNLGQLFTKLGKSQKAAEHFEKAIERYRQRLVEEPRSAATWESLGDALAENSRFSEASTAFSKALELNPINPTVRIKLIKSLEFQNRLDEAIGVAEKGFEVMSQMQQTEIAMKFKQLMDYLKYKKQIAK